MSWFTMQGTPMVLDCETSTAFMQCKSNLHACLFLSIDYSSLFNYCLTKLMRMRISKSEVDSAMFNFWYWFSWLKFKLLFNSAHLYAQWITKNNLYSENALKLTYNTNKLIKTHNNVIGQQIWMFCYQWQPDS